jgi:hypothetical protein
MNAEKLIKIHGQMLAWQLKRQKLNLAKHYRRRSVINASMHELEVLFYANQMHLPKKKFHALARLLILQHRKVAA